MSKPSADDVYKGLGELVQETWSYQVEESINKKRKLSPNVSVLDLSFAEDIKPGDTSVLLFAAEILVRFDIDGTKIGEKLENLSITVRDLADYIIAELNA
jgi:hypothetical protein